MRDHEVPSEVARGLQSLLDQINIETPADHDAPWFSRVYRHACMKARQSKQLAGKGVSTAIDLKERYISSDDETFAILFKEGTCKRCHETARSARGCCIEVGKRPSLEGRVARG